MILAGHQPEYLPYLGFFYKITQCDEFVLVDHVQFLKKAFQNRNYIRSKTGKILLTVPVLTKGCFDQRINEVLINNEPSWAKKHWMTIKFNYSSCQFFDDYAPYFADLYSKSWKWLVDLNITIIEYLMKCFSIEKKLALSSQYNIVGEKTDMLIDLCEKLKAHTYVSGWGAKAYVEPDEFVKYNLCHRFLQFVHPEYKQHYKPFIPNLSAIDLLFNYGPHSKDILSKAHQLSSTEHL